MNREHILAASRWMAGVVAISASAACWDTSTVRSVYMYYQPPDREGKAPQIRMSAAMFLGDSVRLIAIAETKGYGEIGPGPRTISDSRMAPGAFRWASSDTMVATVDSGGAVVTRRTGTTTLTVESAGVISWPLTLKVIPAVAVFRLVASASPVTVGDTLRVTVTALDATGREVPGVAFDLSPGEPAWTTLVPVGTTQTNTGSASVSLRAAVAGSIVLTASSGDRYDGRSISGTLTVMVVPK